MYNMYYTFGIYFFIYNNIYAYVCMHITLHTVYTERSMVKNYVTRNLGLLRLLSCFSRIDISFLVSINVSGRSLSTTLSV